MPLAVKALEPTRRYGERRRACRTSGGWILHLAAGHASNYGQEAAAAWGNLRHRFGVSMALARLQHPDRFLDRACRGSSTRQRYNRSSTDNQADELHRSGLSRISVSIDDAFPVRGMINLDSEARRRDAAWDIQSHARCVFATDSADVKSRRSLECVESLIARQESQFRPKP